jgi:transmembrane sensor
LDQACAWIARLRSDLVDTADRRKFSDWLAESADNQQAFAQMSELWGDLGALTHFPLDELYPESRPCSPRSTQTRAKRGERAVAGSGAAVATGNWNFSQWLMGGGLVAACLVVTLWVGNQWLNRDGVQQRLYATQVGETRTISLADGSQVQLNTNSELRVSFSRGERRTELLRGEAYFDVARQTSRPFTVAAGSANVRVLGTEFNVERNADNTRVSVTGGTVSVSEAKAARGLHPESVKLSKNQKVSVSSAGISAVNATSAEQALDWTRGVLVFDQTPLAEALEELNRYLKVPAQADPSVREQALSGTFELSDPDNTLAAIAAALDLQQDHSDPNLTLLSPKRN